jgi:hypothetical protein
MGNKRFPPIGVLRRSDSRGVGGEKHVVSRVPPIGAVRSVRVWPHS